MTWRTDMENAPRDGTQVLLYAPPVNGYPAIYLMSRWVGNRRNGRWWDWFANEKPTHWQCLPAAPEDRR